MHLRNHRQRAVNTQKWQHHEKRWPFRPAKLNPHTETRQPTDEDRAAAEEAAFYEELERGYAKDRI